jgi:hypothetical protein
MILPSKTSGYLLARKYTNFTKKELLTAENAESAE